MCDYVECVNGICVDDTTIAACYRCQCRPGFTGPLCETPIATRMLIHSIFSFRFNF